MSVVKKAYVIMKKRLSPIGITEPKPHSVCCDLNSVRKMVKGLNSRATSCDYWYETVKVNEIIGDDL